MTVLLDSADLNDVSAAAALGFVTGVTTNPTLLRQVTSDPLTHAAELLAATDFPEVYYQPTGAHGDLLDEALQAWKLAPERIVLKVPATPGGAVLAQRLVREGVPVSLTAAQSPNAMIIAEAIGAASVIPYVDRAWRDPRIGNDLVRQLAALRRGSTRIVAASVKNAGQFTQAFADGADAVTAPLGVLTQVLAHPAALEAEQAFAGEYGG
ncbi:transaldolase family protein [Lentzea chajnantorensis]